MKRKPFFRSNAILLACGLACVAALSACSKFQQTASQSPVSAAAEASSGATSASLELAYDKPVVGATVHATAAGLPPGKRVELTWGTVEGGWVVEDYYHFRGKKYSETTSKLGEFSSDSSGRLDASFRIPEDYGGVHEVIALVDGKAVAQNGIDVTQSFELEPRTGPVGTPVELRVKGFGWRTMESTWVVSWDNNNVGFVSAASTRGSATARFRASGPAGDHVIKIYTGWQGQSYLNYEQSPVARMPRPAIHLPDHGYYGAGQRSERDAGGVRRAVSETAGEACGSETGRSDAGGGTDARSRGHAGDAARRRISSKHAAEAGVGNVRGQPGERLGVRARR